MRRFRTDSKHWCLWVRFQDVCDYVDYLCLDSLQVKRLTKDECAFGYRDSIFRKRFITGLLLSQWVLNSLSIGNRTLTMVPLKELGEDCTARQVFERVCQVRSEKLPNPAVTGNAGGFFKKPRCYRAAF